MSCPNTRPGNASKHPGNMVQEASRVQHRSKEEVTSEKAQKQAQKDAHAAAVNKSCTTIAAAEDAMTNHVDANRKVSNGGVTISTSDSDTHVGSAIGDGKIKMFHVRHQVPEPLAGSSNYEPEEYSEPTSTIQRGKNIVHVKEKPKLTSRGKKRSFKNTEYSAEEFDAAEEFEMLQDPDAAEDQEILKDPDAAEGFEDTTEGFEDTAEGFEDAAEDEDHMVLMTDDSQRTTDAKASVAQRMSSMSVNVSNQKTTRKHTKGKGNTKVKTQVKMEVKAKTEAPENMRSKIRKGKAKNSNLPSGVVQSGLWRTTFLPCVMFWVGNSDYGWSIPEDILESVLEDIYNGASQRIHEWQAAFGSTAVSVLMAFFASTPEYQAQEAREEYAEYQLQDCCFIYEDPNNEEQPGAFLSEYMLRIFAAHLTTISRKVRVDALIDFVRPGYATALALSAVSLNVDYVDRLSVLSSWFKIAY
ncbi:hypothetical protein BDR03DRAFT_987293 [Suillus americanus]|nr:hypothetical protein BDR03DRAFT_987293 [Suillus americanus]